MQNPSDAAIRTILGSTRVIAVVGISANPDRPSHGVARFLQSRGYRIVPVNPGLAGQELLGEKVWADLASIPSDAEVDMVDVFRRSETVPEVVAEALAHLPKLRTVWMQLGVTSAEAAAMAEARGIAVVQNRCPAIEYPRLMPR
ncbi:CoA-binding protein [Phaeovulum sp.]|uniref:CoA-binding protein n=1 Tax=Phaeovulum sp. TaxID=2934796 RepID=UPI0027320644|nr:CoA-binding protein [Phaeovulum sp.]MDP1669427.1 CoA-binding protein [Phaeovulum sp.]MDP2062326.1 CoA-binding protein [Phaeovulum sp.]MDZ4119697.1 CoA-binding protein [Phaeovulum sp.]